MSRTTSSAQLAKHFQGVFFGGNWTGVNLTDALAGVDLNTAKGKVRDLNSIAALVYHINYYVDAITGVLQGRPLEAKDRYSFDLSPINTSNDWEQLLTRMWKNANTLAGLIENFPDSKLWNVFVDEKYGNYYRNFQGVIEHTHYHLGQIVLIKKLLAQRMEADADG